MLTKSLNELCRSLVLMVLRLVCVDLLLLVIWVTVNGPHPAIRKETIGYASEYEPHRRSDESRRLLPHLPHVDSPNRKSCLRAHTSSRGSQSPVVANGIAAVAYGVFSRHN